MAKPMIEPIYLNQLSSLQVNQNGQLEQRLKDVERAILGLPSKMPQTALVADSKGFSKRVKTILDKESTWSR